MNPSYEESSNVKRGVCRLPIEVIINRYGVKVWLTQGDGRNISVKELKRYAKSAREWADLMDRMAKEVDNE